MTCSASSGNTAWIEPSRAWRRVFMFWDGTGFDDTVSTGRNWGGCRAAVPCPLLPPFHAMDDDGSAQPSAHPPLHMAEHPLAAACVYMPWRSQVSTCDGAGTSDVLNILSLRLFLASGDGCCCQQREPIRSRIGCRLLGLAACLVAFSVPNGPALIASPTRCPAVRVSSGDGLMAPGALHLLAGVRCVRRVSTTSKAAPALEASRAIGRALPWFCGEASADRDGCVQRWLEGDMKHSAASLSDPGHANKSKVALLTVRRRQFQPSQALELVSMFDARVSCPSPCDDDRAHPTNDLYQVSQHISRARQHREPAPRALVQDHGTRS